MSKIIYKLTNEFGQTWGETQWGPNVSHSGTGKGGLCGPGWIHYYSHPLLAVLLNPIHANFFAPKLWEAAAGGPIKSDSGLKFGCKTLTTLREIPLPAVTTEQRVRFGILCALEVSESASFQNWANCWLSGEDQSRESAERAVWTAESAAKEWAAEKESAEWSAKRAAAAAWSAERSAWAAAWAAESAAESAERSAWVAERAAAARSAWAAERAERAASIDLKALAQKAMVVL